MPPLTPPHKRAGNGSTMPYCMTDISRRYIYGVTVRRSDGNALLFEWDRNSETMTRSFNLATLPGNPLHQPIQSETDGHYAYGVGVDAEGNIHVAGNDHDHTTGIQQYVWCNRSNFTTAGNWVHVPNQFAAASSEAPDAGYTYNYFDRDRNNVLLWAFSQSESTDSPAGRDWLFVKKAPGAAATAWTPVNGTANLEFVVRTQPPYIDASGRSYITGILVYANNRYWVTGLWRSLASDADTNHGQWMIYSDDSGVTWRSLPNTVQTIPITEENAGNAQITTSPTVMGGYPGGLAVETNVGADRVSVLCKDGAEAAAFVCRRCYWNGSSWQQETIANVSAQVKPYLIRDELIYGHHFVTDRFWLRRHADGSQFPYGHSIQSGTGGLNIEPTILREEGVAYLLCPDGDVPAFYTYGAGVRANAA